MFKNASIPFVGFLQATALLAYVLLVVSFINLVESGTNDADNEIYAGVTMIMLFVISAVVSGGIVLGRAGQLFAQKKQAEAYRLVGWTVGWMLVYFLVFVTVFLSS